MTPAEARLLVHAIFLELLTDLSVGDDEEEMTDEEIAETEEAMDNVAEMLLDSIGFDVQSVENGVISATLTLEDPENLAGAGA